MTSTFCKAATAVLLFFPLSLPLQAASLDSAGGFNAVILGNHVTSGGDTEGRLAVQGNMSVTNSYSVGGCSSPDCATLFPPSSSQPQSNGSRTDLVVGGAMTNSGVSAVSWDQAAGNVVVGGTIDPTIFVSSSGAGNTVTASAGDVSSIFDFVAAGTDLRAASQNLANLVVDPSQMGIVTVDQDWQLTLKGTDSALNVFNISASQWASAGYGKSREIWVPLDSRVLINVSGTTISPMSGTMGFGVEGCSLTACEDTTLYAPNVMVNYFEATSVALTQFAHEGSLLAPNALLSADGGFINGQSIIAGTGTQNGFEFHFRDNNGADFSDLANGAISPVPLPAALPLFAMALGGLGGLGLRKRAR